MPKMFEIVDLNGDGKIDICELAKECYGAWGLTPEQCVKYAMEQHPLEDKEIATTIFKHEELGF